MQHKYIAYLHNIGLSQKELFEIYTLEKDFKEIFENVEKYVRENISQAKRKEVISENIKNFRTEKIDRLIEIHQVKIILFTDSEYPDCLKNIYSPPFLLYIRGNLPSEEGFGVVGSRKISDYGKSIIRNIVPEIAKTFTIVSGGAAGCDIEAHKYAMNSNNKTVVVVGTGIDQCYPVNHHNIFEQIVSKGGCVLSIFRFEEPGNPYNFPVRNEIVVALSKGILVVQAQKRSGSLITAKLALDNGKDVFCVPGNIYDSTCEGANHLIASGEAKMVLGAGDILEEYLQQVKKSEHTSSHTQLNSEQKKVFNEISNGSISFDTLCERTSLEPKNLSTMISIFEIQGLVVKNSLGNYELR